MFRFRLEILNNSYNVVVKQSKDNTQVSIDGEWFDLEEVKDIAKTFTLQPTENKDEFKIFLENKEILVHLHQKSLEINQKTQIGMEHSFFKDGNIVAPLSGKIVSVFVEPGQKIKAGESILIFEAMKMENLLTSPIDGIVKDVLVQKGDLVSTNQKLVIFLEN